MPARRQRGIKPDRITRSRKGNPMRRLRPLWVLLASLVAINCSSPPPAPPYHAVATVKDIMDSMVDPNADVLWDSVALIMTLKGTEEKQPRTDEEWAMVRRSAVQVLEATNLLLVPDRHVAKPGEKATDPNVELAPEEIEKVIAADRSAWINLAHGLHDEATAAIQAIDARNASDLMTAGEKIDTACENCHVKYWYPNDPQVGAK